MSSAQTSKTQKKREWRGTHHAWSYRPQAFRWEGENVVGVNMVPLAGEMRAWLQQRGQLSIVSEENKARPGDYTNPYTFSGSSLSLILGRVVNAYSEYAAVESDDTEVDAEIERLRLYNEVLLYAARMCEAVIKQLLYCTQIPESRFERMALGALLESPCPNCKKINGDKPHLVSMIGTLAHPFGLCLEFEHCAMDHLDLVNRLRNSEAAHSSIQIFTQRPVAETKQKLFADCHEVMNGLVHLLSHIETLEQKMLKDLANKGTEIQWLKLNGLLPEECNFKLTPGRPFVHEPFLQQSSIPT